MRVHPKIYDHGSPLIERTIKPKSGAIQPFLACGGSNHFFSNPSWPVGNEKERGCQYVVGVYVPKGYQGFLKQIRVAPHMPAILNPKFLVYDGVDYYAFWAGFNDFVTNDPIRPDGITGVWETPYGWESYYNIDSEGPLSIPPRWTWQLRIINGDPKELRRSHTNFPAPNLTDISSWFMVPDNAVPIEAYGSGFPGTTPGIDFGPQRLQVLQGDMLSLHVPIPEDSTIALFTEWEQYEFQPRLEYAQSLRTEYYDALVYPLLPSFGSLAGYMQVIGDAAAENLQHGWGA